MLNNRTTQAVITTLRNNEDQVRTQSEDILTEIHRFFSGLYSHTSTHERPEIEEYLRRIEVPTLSQTDVLALEEPITEDEIRLTIKELAGNKTPGVDGLGIEFYKQFSGYVTPLLLAVYDEALDTGSIPIGMNMARIALVPKRGKESDCCADFRPLSLLNSDMKILAKILANRLLPLLPGVIHSDQSGFVPGRSTEQPIRRVFNILAATPTQSSTAFVAFDAMKAFDTVQWPYLLAVLDRFGFGDRFRKWIRVLYTNVQAFVAVNGSRTLTFPVHRGTRQGCPLSAMLFALCMEPLLARIRAELDGFGVSVRGIPVMAMAYADDLMVVLNDPECHLPELLALIEDHSGWSGFCINWGKSKYFPVGDSAPSSSPCPELDTAQEQFRYLGVIVAKTQTEIYDLNYVPLLTYLKQKTDKWATLPLSLAGRISVVKMLVLPKFLYTFNNVPIVVKKPFFDKCRMLITSFIWNSKAPRIAYSQMTRSYKEGGFELPDMYSYYQAAQLHHAIRWLEVETREPHIKMEQRWFTGHQSARLITDDRIKPKGALGPAKVGLQIWRKVLVRDNQMSAYSKHLSLWEVSGISPRLTLKMFTEWLEHGIITLQDLYTEGTLNDEKDIVDSAGGGHLAMLRWKMLKHCIRQRWITYPLKPPDNPLLSHVLTSIGSRHQTSHIYKILRDMGALIRSPYRAKWEIDVGDIISDKVWARACELTGKVSLSMRLRLVHYKFLSRSYMTPERLNKIFKQDSACCKKCDLMGADYLHMVWACPGVQHYWSEVCDLLSVISGTPLRMSLMLIFMYKLPKMHKDMEKWICVALAAAKMVVAKLWIKQRPPTVKDWYGELTYCEEQEATLRMLMHRSQSPRDIWGPYRAHLCQLQDATDSEDA